MTSDATLIPSCTTRRCALVAFGENANASGSWTLTHDVFKNFDANVEVAFSSPLFSGRSIDVLFLPGFFDLYRMIDHPYESNSGIPQ